MKELLCKNLWDFNSKVGKNTSNDEIMKNHCIGIIIENGKRLMITKTLALAEPSSFLSPVTYTRSYVGLNRHEKEATYMQNVWVLNDSWQMQLLLAKMKLKLLKHTSKNTIELISTIALRQFLVIQYARIHDISYKQTWK